MEIKKTAMVLLTARLSLLIGFDHRCAHYKMKCASSSSSSSSCSSSAAAAMALRVHVPCQNRTLGKHGPRIAKSQVNIMLFWNITFATLDGMCGRCVEGKFVRIFFKSNPCRSSIHWSMRGYANLRPKYKKI